MAKLRSRLPKKPTKPTKPIMDDICLPTKCSVPPDGLTSYCLMLFGEKGIGKTSLCAQIPELTTIMWEPLRKNLKIKQIPKPGEQRLNWPRFKQYVPLIVERQQPVSIDTIDRCYAACLEYHCQMHPDRPTTPHGMDDWGKLWSEIKVDFEQTMNELLYSDIFVIFVSHGRYREMKTLTGEVDNEQVIPTAPNAAFEYMKAVCDMVMYYGYVGKKRTITIRGNELVFAACGMEDRFKDGDNPIVIFDAGKSAKQAYQNLESAFNNKLHSKMIIGKEYEEDELEDRPKKRSVKKKVTK